MGNGKNQSFCTLTAQQRNHPFGGGKYQKGTDGTTKQGLAPVHGTWGDRLEAHAVWPSCQLLEGSHTDDSTQTPYEDMSHGAPENERPLHL